MKTLTAIVVSAGLLLTASAQDARAIMAKTEKHLDGLKSMEMTMSMKMTGPMSQNMNGSFAMKRPNFLKANMDMGAMKMQQLSDGKFMYSYNASSNTFTKQPAPKDLKSSGMAGGMGVSQLKISQDKTAKLKYVKRDTVNGKPVHVIEATNVSMIPIPNHKMWAYVGVNDNLMHRYVVEGTMPGGQGQAAGQKMRMEMNFAYKSIGKDLPNSMFVWKAPAGAKEQKMAQPMPVRPQGKSK